MNRPLLLICLLSIVHFTALSTVQPLVPLFASKLGASEALVGVIIAAGALVPFLLAMPAGLFTDRVGPRRMMLLAAAGMTLSGGLLATAAGLVLVTLAQVIRGTSHLFMMIAVQSYVSRLGGSADEAVERGFGLFTFAAAIGTTVGPLMGGWLAQSFGYPLAFSVSAAATLLAILTAYLLPRHDALETSSQDSLLGSLGRAWQLLHQPLIQVGVWGSFAMVFAISLFNSFYPLYLQQLGYAPGLIGLVISIYSLASVLVRPFLHQLISLSGRLPLYLGSLALAVVGLVLTPLLNQLVLLALAAAIVGVAKGFSQPLSMIIVSAQTGPEERGRAMGLRLMANRGAAMLSPAIFGLLASAAGLPVVFFACALELAATAGWLVTLPRADGQQPARPDAPGPP